MLFRERGHRELARAEPEPDERRVEDNRPDARGRQRAEDAGARRARRRGIADGSEPGGRERADEARERGSGHRDERVDRGERGGEQRADDEEELLHRRLERVRGRAEVTRREPRPDDPHRRGDRREDEAGERSDDRDGDGAGVDRGQGDDEPEEGRVADGAVPQDGAGPRRSTRLPRIGAPRPSAIEYTATTTPAAP